MAFYRVDVRTNTLESGPSVLLPDNTYLTEENHEEFTYPVQLWYWFDTEAEAIIALQPDVLTEAALLLAAAQTLDEVRSAGIALLEALGMNSE